MNANESVYVDKYALCVNAVLGLIGDVNVHLYASEYEFVYA